jgi:drug/metabolite transporter (DMT)-like permease
MIELHLFCTRAATHVLVAMKRSSPLVLLAFVIVSIVLGSTYFGIRVALESFPPFLIGAARFLVAGGVLLALARARGERTPTAAHS